VSESPIATSGSHTATDQWQSFEMRMRRRRAGRCLLRAEAALDAGFLDDAREALDEAAGLTPDDPAVPMLLSRLADARIDADVQIHSLDLPVDIPLVDSVSYEFEFRLQAPLEASPIAAADASRSVGASPASAEEARTRWPFIAAAMLALMLAGSGTVAWYWTQSLQSVPQRASPSTSGESVSAANRTTTLPPSAPAPEQLVSSTPPDAAADAVAVVSTDVAAGTGGRERTAPVPAPEAPEPIERDPETERAKIADVSTGPRGSDAPDDAPVTPRVADAMPAPSMTTAGRPIEPPPPRPDPIPVPAAPLAAVAEIPAARTPAPAAVLPAAATGNNNTSPPDPAVDRERLVRAALTRYENAYSSLNAAAASAVWPSVDRRALARAFEDLNSQTVTLGRCDVRMNGEAAQAECAGRASWTPKVGGGPQTATRRWRFELKQNGTDWLIVRAAVQ
jgi:hypothetical protein